MSPGRLEFREMRRYPDVTAGPLHSRLPRRVQIVEVGPRDGLQAEERTLLTETKLLFIERLLDAGHTVIEATSFVSPKAVPQLADAEELVKRLPRREGVRYPVLVPNERGLERAIGAGATEVAVFASASESYYRKNLNRSRDDAIDGYRVVIRTAKDARLRVRGYLSMVIADPWDGATPAAVAVDAGRRLLDLGADELSLGDTIGVGTPADVQRLIGAYHEAGVDPQPIWVHFHATYGHGLANGLAALHLAVTTGHPATGGVQGLR